MMKRFLITLVMLCLCLSFLSCGDEESNAEREYREAVKAAEQAGKAADKAKKEYNELKDALDRLEKAQNGSK